MSFSFTQKRERETKIEYCSKQQRHRFLKIRGVFCSHFWQNAPFPCMEIPELLLLVMETSLVSLCMKIMSVLITVILYGRMIEIYLYCSVSPIPFATMTNREWGQIGNNYLKGLFALGFQGFLIMICVGIYAVLVNEMVVADNLHSAIFSLAAYTVILCFSLFKSGALAKSIFNAH